MASAQKTRPPINQLAKTNPQKRNFFSFIRTKPKAEQPIFSPQHTQFNPVEIKSVLSLEKEIDGKIKEHSDQKQNLIHSLVGSADGAAKDAILKEIANLDDKINNLSVNFRQFALNCLEQSPISQSELIGYTGAILEQMQNGRYQNGDAAKSQLEMLNAVVKDCEVLEKERMQTAANVLGVAFDGVKNGISRLKIEINHAPGFIEEQDKKTIADFQKRISDLAVVLESLHKAGEGNAGVYKKLETDIDYLKRMDNFIRETARGVRKVMDKIEAKIGSLELAKSNVDSAMKSVSNEKADIGGKVANLKKMLWAAAGMVGAGSATFLATPKTLSQAIIGAAVMVGGIVGAILLPPTREFIRAAYENSIIRMYDRRIMRQTNKVVKYANSNKRLVGFKAAKEMAISGYWMDLKGLVPDPISAAAYLGDLKASNDFYIDQRKKALRGFKAYITVPTVPKRASKFGAEWSGIIASADSSQPTMRAGEAFTPGGHPRSP